MSSTKGKLYYIIDKSGHVTEIRKQIGKRFLIEKANNLQTKTKYPARWVEEDEFNIVPDEHTMQLIPNDY
jgi:ribulose 1,5-bisphosphate synthetase/thiazole synthase